MKAIIQKSSRPLVILAATVVVIITTMVVANATQTITTPNAAFISYNLAAGANSAAITPVTNKPVLVMGCCTVIGGAGQVTLLSNSFAPEIDWSGVESAVGSPSTPSTTGGFSSIAGTHIVFLDFNHTVDIQTASADTIRVHNGQSATRAGSVTLIW